MINNPIYKELAKSNKTVAMQFEVFVHSIGTELLEKEAYKDLFKVDKWSKIDAQYHIQVTYKGKKEVHLAEDLFAYLYVKYYRGLQLFILPEQVRIVALEMALRTSPILSLKAIQKVCKTQDLDCSGVIGPATRVKMETVTKEQLEKVRDSLSFYLQVLFYRLTKKA